MVFRTQTRAWLFFLILGLPAYVGGAFLHLRHHPDAKLGVSVDREKAIVQAARYAMNLGYNVSEWTPYLRFEPDNDRYFYYRQRRGPEQDLARRFAPEALIGVRFQSLEKDESLEIFINVEGRPLGYSSTVSRTIQIAASGEEEARRSALETIRRRLEGTGITAPSDISALREVELDRRDHSSRNYRWRWPLSGMPEMVLESEIRVRGGRVVGDLVIARIDEAYAKKELLSVTPAEQISRVIYYLLLLIVIAFGIFRFTQRVRQKEVSYFRSIILAVVVGAISSSPLWFSDVGTYDSIATPDFPVPKWLIIISGSFFLLIIGLFLGLAYGSGEGDLREPYPGKLASLDALLSGHLLSQNVARAVLIGAALGGWVFLLTVLVRVPINLPVNLPIGQPIELPTGQPIELLNSGIWGGEIGKHDDWFGHLPWLYGFTFWMPDVILIVVIGLLIPLPFLYRRLRSHRRVIPVLMVIVWIACMAPNQPLRPAAPVLLIALIRMAITIVGFLEFDLLTVVIALGVPVFFSDALSLMAQPSPELSRSGMISIGIALGMLAIEAFLSFRGISYQEEEVRPLYAQNLAERLSMQAEIGAAREVQIRLMPESLPKVAGVTLAAECLPAREVGGDFYDIFLLHRGDHRQPGSSDQIAILVAEGGGNGLGSALSIAFAKGFLLPKISGAQSEDAAPTELLRALQDRLLMQPEHDLKIGFLLALIDAGERRVRYARTSDYPRLRLKSGATLRTPAEQGEQIRSFSSVYRAEEVIELIEGELEVNRGDTILITTDGLERNISKAGDARDADASLDHFLASILDRCGPGQTAGQTAGQQSDLQRDLQSGINRVAKRIRKAGVEDDLTAVIVRIEGA